MLDARVYCNCLEAGKLRLQPKPHWRVSVLDDGTIEAECLDQRERREFHRWWKHACEHEDRVLVYHCLGNVAMVSFLRAEFAKVAGKCLVLLGRVVSDGVHGGDFLTVEQVRDLEGELRELDGFQCESEADQPYVDRFLDQMRELVAASLSVSKPIAF
jgi:hypothetical protein